MSYINEVEANEINLKPFKPKKELHPDFFDKDGALNSQIRMRLLDISDDFIDTLEVKWVKPLDIVLTGSIANYNWSKYSDVDIHIIYKFDEVYSKPDFVKDYFDSKKEQWNQSHTELTIKGFPVEFSVEDKASPAQATGVYSLEKNKWVKEPQNLNDSNLNKEYIKGFCAKQMTKLDNLFDEMDSEKDLKKLETLSNKIEAIYRKLKNTRKEGLATKEKEMSTGNIIWKVIKHAGYIKKIWEYINITYDKTNTIKEHKSVYLSESQYKEIETMMNRPTAYLMVGIPGSGKSTWVKQNLPGDVEIISRDILRAKLGYTKDADDKAVLDRKAEETVTKCQQELIRKCGLEGRDIVIDDMNTGKYRKGMIQTLRDNGFRVVGVKMNTSLETCIARRKGQISPEVMRNINKKVIALSPEEVDMLVDVEDNSDK